MKRSLTVVFLALGVVAARASSLAEFDQRAKAGEALTVAFIGGSLTWGANASDPNKTSSRALVGEKLRAHYPRARWRFVDAAIGGTGSELGVFRLERDVLASKPDLVFLDFTANDGIEGTDAASLSSYESIVRTVLTRGACPVVPVIYPAKRHVLMADVDSLPRRVAHLKLADYYNLTAADVVKGMNARVKAGELRPDELWPLDLFDTTHPHDAGYAVYADEIWKAYLAGVADAKAFTVPEKWLFTDDYRHVLRFRLGELKTLPRGWRIGKPEVRAGTFDFLSSRWMERVAIAANCTRRSFDAFELNGFEPEPLTVRFRGSSVLLFGESTIFSGNYDVLIDGEKRATCDASRFADSFPPSAYLNHPVARGLDPDREHTLTIVPKFEKGKAQHLHLESICIAGPKPVSVME